MSAGDPLDDAATGTGSDPDATPEARRGRLKRRLFALTQALAAEPQGLTWDEAWERMKEAVPAVPDDLELVSNKVDRGLNNVKWYAIDLAKAGWIIQLDSHVRITRFGRAALIDFPDPDSFFDEAHTKYGQWESWRQPENHGIELDPTTELLPRVPSQQVVTDALGPLLRIGLLDGASTFQPEERIWTRTNIKALHQAIVEGFDQDHTKSFTHKLQDQLSDVPDDARILLAEILSVLLGSLVDWHKDTKRSRVRLVLMTMDDPVAMSMEVDAAMDHGIFGGGVGYKSGLFARIGEFLEFLQGWDGLPQADKEAALSDPWSFQSTVTPALLPDGSLLGLLLVVLFPQQVPSVVSTTHVKQIVTAFANELPNGRSGNDRRDLSTITLALQQELDQPVNYYENPLREAWKPVGDQPRAWLVRGSSVSGTNLVPYWTDEGFVSLPAAHFAQLEEPLDRPTVVEAVNEAFSGRTSAVRRQKADEYDRFLRVMKADDLVITTSEGKVRVGTVDGESLEWVEDSALPARVRRPVTWSSDPTDWSGLPDQLQARLSANDDVADVTEDIEAVQALLAKPEDDVPDVKPDIVEPPVVVPRVARLPEVTDEMATELHLPVEWLNRLVAQTNRRQQMILYGPPGTGKTYVATKLAEHWADPGNVTLVQFHPSVSYEDFVAGYRPVEKDGKVVFEIRDGPFMRLAERARENPGEPHVLVIDEINRANLAKVFGELYFLLEYRDHPIEPLYSDEGGNPFTLPKNLFIIGTMNTADRSIALVDAAMRRRFGFVELHPDTPPINQLLRDWLAGEGHPAEPADLLDALNERIPHRDFAIGPSYFMKDWIYETDDGLEEVWESDLLPLLEEHHAGESLDVRAQYGLPALRKAIEAASPVEVIVQDED